jgi:hypothetical protein
MPPTSGDQGRHAILGVGADHQELTQPPADRLSVYVHRRIEGEIRFDPSSGRDRLELALRSNWPSALGGRSSPRHQDLREGSASEALLFDDVELQVLIELGEWTVARADRNRDRRQMIFVDETQPG